jgi:hypothetical protein
VNHWPPTTFDFLNGRKYKLAKGKRAKEKKNDMQSNNLEIATANTFASVLPAISKLFSRFNGKE